MGRSCSRQSFTIVHPADERCGWQRSRPCRPSLLKRCCPPATRGADLPCRSSKDFREATPSRHGRCKGASLSRRRGVRTGCALTRPVRQACMGYPGRVRDLLLTPCVKPVTVQLALHDRVGEATAVEQRSSTHSDSGASRTYAARPLSSNGRGRVPPRRWAGIALHAGGSGARRLLGGPEWRRRRQECWQVIAASHAARPRKVPWVDLRVGTEKWVRRDDPSTTGRPAGVLWFAEQLRRDVHNSPQSPGGLDARACVESEDAPQYVDGDDRGTATFDGPAHCSVPCTSPSSVSPFRRGCIRP